VKVSAGFSSQKEGAEYGLIQPKQLSGRDNGETKPKERRESMKGDTGRLVHKGSVGCSEEAPWTFREKKLRSRGSSNESL